MQAPTIFCRGQPLFSKIPRSFYKGLTPPPEHNCIHPSSFHWSEHSPLTATLPFEWVNGLISVTDYPKWFERQPRPCPLCSHDHPLDHCLLLRTANPNFQTPLPTASESPLVYACEIWVFAMCPVLRGSTVSYVGDAHFPKHSLEYSLNFWSQSKKKQSQLPDSLRHQILGTWPTEIQSQLRPLLITQPSLDAPRSLRDRRNFIRALLPTTYSHQLLPITSLNLRKAFSYHSKLMSTVAPTVLKALHEAPLPFIPPPLPPTHAAFTAFSNTSTYSPLHNPPPPPATYTPISSLPPPPAFKPTPAQAKGIKKGQANTVSPAQPTPKAMKLPVQHPPPSWLLLHSSRLPPPPSILPTPSIPPPPVPSNPPQWVLAPPQKLLPPPTTLTTQDTLFSSAPTPLNIRCAINGGFAPDPD